MYSSGLGGFSLPHPPLSFCAVPDTTIQQLVSESTFSRRLLISSSVFPVCAFLVRLFFFFFYSSVGIAVGCANSALLELKRVGVKAVPGFICASVEHGEAAAPQRGQTCTNLSHQHGITVVKHPEKTILALRRSRGHQGVFLPISADWTTCDNSTSAGIN